MDLPETRDVKTFILRYETMFYAVLEEEFEGLVVRFGPFACSLVRARPRGWGSGAEGTCVRVGGCYAARRRVARVLTAGRI